MVSKIEGLTTEEIRLDNHVKQENEMTDPKIVETEEIRTSAFSVEESEIIDRLFEENDQILRELAVE